MTSSRHQNNTHYTHGHQIFVLLRLKGMACEIIHFGPIILVHVNYPPTSTDFCAASPLLIDKGYHGSVAEIIHLIGHMIKI